MINALVTGGAGFIGHHLVRGLVDSGADVVVLDDFSTGDRVRLEGFGDRIEIIEGDLRDPAAVGRAVRGRDVVFHLGAIPSVARSVIDPLRSNSVNVDGTIELMIAAANAGVRRLVMAGSSSVYGASPDLPRRESQLPDPRSPYAASKIAGEYYVHSMGALTGVETVVLRYFNVFGPGQDPQSQYAAVVPRFVTAALRGERPVVFGDGTQSRDFTYVDNVVAANLLAASCPDVAGLTANVGCGTRFTLLDLLAAIGGALGVTLTPTFEPTRPGDVHDSEADISIATARLGYRVQVPFEEGIAQTVAWYRQQAGDDGVS